MGEEGGGFLVLSGSGFVFALVRAWWEVKRW